MLLVPVISCLACAQNCMQVIRPVCSRKTASQVNWSPWVVNCQTRAVQSSAAETSLAASGDHKTDVT